MIWREKFTINIYFTCSSHNTKNEEEEINDFYDLSLKISQQGLATQGLY